MKNTLAENMLRFGTKNLSESVKHRLTEGVEPIITPHYKSLDGIIYRTPFKTHVQLSTFTTPPKLGLQVTTSDGNQQIDPNTTSVDNDYYHYAGAILLKVALAGKYNPADYKTPEIFRDYIFNTDIEATNSGDTYDRIICKNGKNVKGAPLNLNQVWELIKYNIIDEEDYIRANSSKKPVPGQSLADSSKHFSQWNTMLATLNSIIPTRFNAVYADPGVFWKNPSNKINVNN